MCEYLYRFGACIHANVTKGQMWPWVSSLITLIYQGRVSFWPQSDPVSASPVLGWRAAATSALLWDVCHRSKLWHSKLCGKHSTHRVISTTQLKKNIASSLKAIPASILLVVIDLFKLFKVSWFDFGKSYVCRNSSTLTRFSSFFKIGFLKCSLMLSGIHHYYPPFICNFINLCLFSLLFKLL